MLMEMNKLRKKSAVEAGLSLIYRREYLLVIVGIALLLSSCSPKSNAHDQVVESRNTGNNVFVMLIRQKIHRTVQPSSSLSKMLYEAIRIGDEWENIKSIFFIQENLRIVQKESYSYIIYFTGGDFLRKNFYEDEDKYFILTVDSNGKVIQKRIITSEEESKLFE